MVIHSICTHSFPSSSYALQWMFLCCVYFFTPNKNLSLRSDSVCVWEFPMATCYVQDFSCLLILIRRENEPNQDSEIVIFLGHYLSSEYQGIIKLSINHAKPEKDRKVWLLVANTLPSPWNSASNFSFFFLRQPPLHVSSSNTNVYVS